MRKIQGMIGIAAVLVLSGTLFNATAQTATNDAATKESYCTTTGGTLENRVPFYGTNNAFPQWLRLSGGQNFCQYTSASDGSRIHVSMDTLYATKPSLAALAYYAQVPWNGQGNGNPASFYCTQLGGSDLFGGANLAGGGWVTKQGVDQVLEACIFPDNSTIDSWGLLYHSVGIIRGVDLSTVLKYANPYATAKSKTP
jgi:putative hemolysin